ncbi:MAG: sugar transferase [Verrucomicrobiaceae bacterium]
MKAVVVLPDHRECAGFARRMRPLALLPVMGRDLLDLWLEKLAADGVKEVTLLVADRPDKIRRAVSDGGRWGLKANIIPVPKEPTLEAASTLFSTDAETKVVALETLPDSRLPLWESTEGLYDVMRRKFNHVEPESRLTMRRLASDVFVSTRARIAPTAVIEGPAWIGPRVIIGENAHIMGGSIIENAAFIDREATVRGSWIGPGTYVGAMTEVSHSFAWGDGLENWRLASFVEITDDFLLASLKRQYHGGAPSAWTTRLFALLLMLITLPLAVFVMLRTKLLRHESAITRRQVLLPQAGRQDRFSHTTPLHTLNGLNSLFSRWPELWRVFRGDLHLIGNRPLTTAEAEQLGDEFEQLWLASPAGVFSLADAADDGLDSPEAHLAHAACYSVRRSFRMNLRILLRCLPRFLALTGGHSPAAGLTSNINQTCQA